MSEFVRLGGPASHGTFGYDGRRHPHRQMSSPLPTYNAPVAAEIEICASEKHCRRRTGLDVTNDVSFKVSREGNDDVRTKTQAALRHQPV